MDDFTPKGEMHPLDSSASYFVCFLEKIEIRLKVLWVPEQGKV